MIVNTANWPITYSWALTSAPRRVPPDGLAGPEYRFYVADQEGS